MLHLIDSHTHIQFAAFDRDYKEVIKRAQEKGIGMITVGTQKDTSARAVEISREFENVWATVGLHPIHTERSYHDPQEVGTFQHSQECKNVAGRGFMSRGEQDFDYEYYKKLASDPKVVAIGECGLDYYRLQASSVKRQEQIEKQKAIFLKQMELAHELQKPLMIHCRPSSAKASEGKASKSTNDAYEDLLNLLHASSFKLQVKIAHFYAGSLTIAKKLLEQDFYFTFGGVITFVPRSQKATGTPAANSGLGAGDYDEIIKFLPLDRIMVETDAPYVAPEPYRGQRNEPAYVAEVAKKLAEIKGVGFEKIAEITTQNCSKVFNLK